MWYSDKCFKLAPLYFLKKSTIFPLKPHIHSLSLMTLITLTFSSLKIVQLPTPHIILEHMRFCIINLRIGKIKIISYPRLIIIVLLYTPLIQALEEVEGSVKEEHLVSSSAPTFNISNLIKMRLMSPKNGIRPHRD